MKLVDAVVEALLALDVRYVFGVSGANIEHLHDSIHRLGGGRLVSAPEDPRNLSSWHDPEASERADEFRLPRCCGQHMLRNSCLPIGFRGATAVAQPSCFEYDLCVSSLWEKK
jgi:hypothetical protein